MNTYNCKFIGRESGALGISSFFEKNVQADSADQAHLKLYDTHEHIMKFLIVDSNNPKDFKSSKHIH